MAGMRKFLWCLFGVVLFTHTNGLLTGGDCQSCITLVDTLKLVSPSMFESSDSLCDSVDNEADKAICQTAMAGMKDMSSRQICVVFEQCKAEQEGDESEMLGTDGEDELVFESEIRNADSDMSELHVQDSLICNICDLAVDFLHRFLSKPNAEKEIMKLARMLCSYIPYLHNTCDALVNEYGSMIIHFAQEFIQPGICHTWLHCPKLEAVLKAKTNCRLCRFGAGLVIDTLRDPLLDTRINLYTQDFCARAADDDHLQASECAQTAAELSEFLKKLAADLSPPTYMKGACENMAVCPAGEEDVLGERENQEN